MRFSLKNGKKLIVWHQIGFPDPRNVILRAIECLNVILGNILNGMSHRKRFTTSSA